MLQAKDKSKNLKAKLDSISNAQVVHYVVTYVFPISFFIILIIVGFLEEGSQQFSNLANAFLHGQTNFLQPIGGLGQDPVYYHGKIFWDEGPFPAVILMPFVALFNLFHLFFYQGYIKWLFVVGTMYFIYQLAKKFKYTKEDCVILVIAFVLASVYLGAASVSSGWLYAQVVGTFLLFWALYEFYGRRRWWLIGLISSFIVLTRITAAPILIFMALSILLTNKTSRDKLHNLVKLFGFVVLAAIVIGAYNYQRFGNPLDNGNKYQLLSIDSAEARSLGLFSLDHIPTNLYTALLRGPNIVTRDSTSWTLKPPYIDNNPLGMSIFLTSPYFLYMFTRRWSKYSKEAKLLVISALVSALFVLAYFGDGADQFGYRYSLDFLPELFVAFMLLYRQYNSLLTRGMKFLIVASSIFDFYLISSYIK
jgi:hypothetical protein